MREVGAGRRVALCAVVATRGSTPQPAGVMVAVDEAAGLTGTIGGGCVEADVRRQAHGLLSEAATDSNPSPAEHNSGKAPGSGSLITFTLDHDFGYDDGLICGGQMDVAIEVLSSSTDVTTFWKAVDRLRGGLDAAVPIRVPTAEGPVEYRIRVEPSPKLVIAGAGHISRILADMTVRLDFTVHVIDDRLEFANAQRFPHPIKPVVGDISGTLAEWPIDAGTYIVVVTRGHKHDEQALEAVLDSPARYIGMIGSRRKIKVIFDDLLHGGASKERLSRVHAPVGLDIGGVTVEEIALSIAAQLVSVRRSERHKAVEGPFPISDAAS